MFHYAHDDNRITFIRRLKSKKILMPNLSIQVEYRYSEYDVDDLDSSSLFGSDLEKFDDYEEDSFRLGLNYRF